MLNSLFLKIAIVAVVAFAAALATGTASADPDPNCVPNPLLEPSASNPSGLDACVHTFATVPSGASAPEVLWKWELPDMDPIAAGMQYTTAAVPVCTYDPAAPTVETNTPCVNAAGNDVPLKNTGDYGHLHHDAPPVKAPGQMVVEPNIDDKPGKRMIEIWAVVTDLVGGVQDISSVQATVTDSTGAKKIGSPVSMNKAACDDLANPLDSTSMRHAAENTGGLTHDKVDPIACSVQQQYQPYVGSFLLNNNQPWGKYTVCVTAIDTQSNTSPALCNQFLVTNVVAFKIDFVAVDYGSITPGVTTSVSPGNIENTGNSDACLDVEFTEMVGKVLQNKITVFDAELAPEVLDINTLIPAGDTFWDPNPARFATLLTSKAPQKIRFSVHPETGLASDLYQGTLNLSVKPCKDTGVIPGAP